MNKYQRLIIIVAAMNVLLMLLFPPFANQPLAKGMIPGLQGFYPVFMQFGKQPVFTELLTLELLFIAINTLIAWLLLNNQTRDGTLPNVGFTFGILCVVTYVTFIYGHTLVRLVGKNGMNAVTRMMGLILAVIGAQMLIAGIQGAFHLSP